MAIAGKFKSKIAEKGAMTVIIKIITTVLLATLVKTKVMTNKRIVKT